MHYLWEPIENERLYFVPTLDKEADVVEIDYSNQDGTQDIYLDREQNSLATFRLPPHIRICRRVE